MKKRHSCLKELLKGQVLKEIPPRQGIFDLNGFEAKNDTDQTIYLIIIDGATLR